MPAPVGLKPLGHCFGGRAGSTLRRHGAALLATLAAVSAETALPAQEVRGRLLDGLTKQPIVLGGLALLDTTFTVVDRTVSDSDGAFVLEAIRPGNYYVLAEGIGYRRVLDGILELDAGGSIEVTFYLQPQPLLVDSVAVEVTRQRTDRYLDGQGFYQRMKSGFGHFITPDEIDQRPRLTIQDLVRGIPNVRAVNGLMGTTFMVRCGEATVWVDGVLVPAADVEIDDIIALEIYGSAASLPLQYGGTRDTCGAVLVWTRHGQPSRR